MHHVQAIFNTQSLCIMFKQFFKCHFIKNFSKSCSSNLRSIDIYFYLNHHQNASMSENRWLEDKYPEHRGTQNFAPLHGVFETSSKQF
jgi:hypothetical protein